MKSNSSWQSQRGLARVVTLVVGSFAVIGAVATYFLVLAPEKIEEVVKSVKAYGSEYRLPDDPPQVPNDAENVKVLKAFSKVFVNIAKTSRPALVFIRTRKKVEARGQFKPFGFPDEFFFPFGRPPGNGRGEPRERFQEGAGSGFIVDLEKGYIVTNNHVVSDSDSIVISTIDDREYPGKIIGGDKDTDVAVVQFEKPQELDRSGLGQVAFGNSDEVEVGDWVVALGAPFQLPQTLTVGVVSALGRDRIIGNASALEDFIQTDAAINPGNSGGPLLSIDGHVIGINTAISSVSGASAGIGFSVPSNIARMVAEKLINTGKVERGFIGIRGQDAKGLGVDVAKKLGLGDSPTGALVHSVVTSSPAEKAGLKPYDVIVGLDGKPIKDFSELRNRVAFVAPGTKVELDVIRDGKTMEIDLTVGSTGDMTVDPDTGEVAPSAEVSSSEKFGFELGELSKDLRESLGVEASKGVLVSKVDERGLASRFGFRSGDVILEINRDAVSNPSEVLAAFEKAESDGSELLVLIERQKRSKLIIVSMR